MKNTTTTEGNVTTTLDKNTLEKMIKQLSKKDLMPDKIECRTSFFGIQFLKENSEERKSVNGAGIISQLYGMPIFDDVGVPENEIHFVNLTKRITEVFKFDVEPYKKRLIKRSKIDSKN